MVIVGLLGDVLRGRMICWIPVFTGMTGGGVHVTVLRRRMIWGIPVFTGMTRVGCMCRLSAGNVLLDSGLHRNDGGRLLIRR